MSVHASNTGYWMTRVWFSVVELLCFSAITGLFGIGIGYLSISKSLSYGVLIFFATGLLQLIEIYRIRQHAPVNSRERVKLTIGCCIRGIFAGTTVYILYPAIYAHIKSDLLRPVCCGVIASFWTTSGS